MLTTILGLDKIMKRDVKGVFGLLVGLGLPELLLVGVLLEELVDDLIARALRGYKRLGHVDSGHHHVLLQEPAVDDDVVDVAGGPV